MRRQAREPTPRPRRMRVSVFHRGTRQPRSAARVAADARRLLRALGEAHAELTVSLVDDRQIQRLNRVYRAADRPTDVLAFAMREGMRTPGDETILGDVVISLETAARQACQHHVTVADEVRTLLIHGVLHLLGYDHERAAAACRMQAMERWLATVLDTAPGTSPRAPCLPHRRRGI